MFLVGDAGVPSWVRPESERGRSPMRLCIGTGSSGHRVAVLAFRCLIPSYSGVSLSCSLPCFRSLTFRSPKLVFVCGILGVVFY